MKRENYVTLKTYTIKISIQNKPTEPSIKFGLQSVAEGIFVFWFGA